MAAASEIYSWNPVYGKKGSSPSTRGESNVRFQSGLKHQVSVRASELKPQQEEVKREPTQKVRRCMLFLTEHSYLSTLLLQETESDSKLISRVANSSLYTSLARCGDLVCILTLVVVIILVIFLGLFFTYFFTK